MQQESIQQQREEPIQPEQNAPEEAQNMRENIPHHRRSVQQLQPEQTEPEQTPPLVRPQDRRVKRGCKHQKKTAKRGQRLIQTLMGIAVLLSMAGAALVKAGRRVTREQMRLAAMALCAVVALVSVWQVGSIVLRSVRTNKLNDELSRQRAAIIKEQEDAEWAPAFEPTAEPAVTAAPATAQTDTLVFAPQNQQAAAPAMAAATIAPDIVRTAKYRGVGGDALPEMAQLYEKNRDLVAWIQIPDVLDLPVVYRNNEYYLTHDFNKQKNASGTIFLDESHPFKEKTQNLLLHGHNMKDGTMFGRLAQYLYDDTYLRNHPFISFDTLWNKEQYVIFAVLNVSLKPSDPRFFNYFTHDTFSSDAEFAMYIRQLQLRSEYAIPIDVEPSDALLTLSTCLEEDRLVIVARRLREGEARSDLRTLIRMAAKQ